MVQTFHCTLHNSKETYQSLWEPMLLIGLLHFVIVRLCLSNLCARRVRQAREQEKTSQACLIRTSRRSDRTDPQYNLTSSRQQSQTGKKKMFLSYRWPRLQKCHHWIDRFHLRLLSIHHLPPPAYSLHSGTKIKEDKRDEKIYRCERRGDRTAATGTSE